MRIALLSKRAMWYVLLMKGSLTSTLAMSALFACGCVASTAPLSPSLAEAPEATMPGSAHGAPASPPPPAESSIPETSAGPRSRVFPKSDLKRMARIASARCQKAEKASDATCVLTEAAAFLKYRPEDYDCRHVAGTAISVAECSTFKEGCQNVNEEDLRFQLEALEKAGKQCERQPTDAEQAEVRRLAGVR